MFFLLYLGGEFGVSANLRTLCAIGGAGKRVPFFDFDWKSQIWNLVFVGGAVMGGFVASHYLQSDAPVKIAQSTIEHLKDIGVNTPEVLEKGSGFLPSEVFSLDQLFTLRGLFFMVIGGILIGFGTRWAGGCTSGHAISGLSNFQLPSLIAVIGFFLGGLLMTHLLLPFLINL